MQPNTPYIVKVIDALTIKLTTGTEAAPQTFTGGNVSGNTITITSHGFVDGQAVTYTDPGLGVSFTSQLVDAFVLAGQPVIDSHGNTVYTPSLKAIYLPGTFSTGDLVRYQAPAGGTAITGLLDGHDYRVLKTAADTSLGYVQLATAAVFTLFGTSFTADSTNGDTIVLGGGLHWTDFGFADGQTITVADTGTGNDGKSFTIATLNGSTALLKDQGKVANTILSIFGGEVYSGLISLDRPVVTPGVPDMHTLTRVTDLPIGGLTSGVTYYVKYLTSDTFQLSATPGGTTLPIDGTGRTANNTIGTTGLDLGVATGGHNLHIDLTTTGNGSLRGPFGVDLTRLLAGDADGKSTATALGGSGSAVEVSTPHGNLVVSPTVRACVGWVDGNSPGCVGTDPGTAGTSIDAGTDISVTATSTVEVTTNVDIHGGGVVNVGTAHGEAKITSTTHSELGDHSALTAGRNLTVNAIANDKLTITVSAPGGGIVAVSVAESPAVMSFDTLVTFGADSRAIALGDLVGHAETSLDGLDEATAFAAGGLGWSSAEANLVNDFTTDGASPGLTLTGTSVLHVGHRAVIEGATVSLAALIPSLVAKAHAGAESFIVLLIGGSVAYAMANTYLDVKANVAIDGDIADEETLIQGLHGVDIRAVIDPVTLERQASRLAVGIVPPQAAIAGPCDVDRTVNRYDGSSFQCREAGLELNTRFPQGTIALQTNVVVGRYVHVIAGARSSGTTLEKPDETAGTPYPALALYVQSHVNIASNTTHTWHLWTQEGVYDFALSEPRPTSNVQFDADVTILGGLEGSPTLVVDSTGNIQAANGVQILCDPGTAGCTVDHPVEAKQGENVDPDGNGSYRVRITNDGGGNVLIAAENTIKNGAGVAKPWPLWEFDDTLGSVTIIDHSTKKLIIDKIDVVAPSTSNPTVWLVTRDDVTPVGDPGPPYSLQFDLQRNAGETFVDVQKIADNSIEIAGTIKTRLGQPSA